MSRSPQDGNGQQPAGSLRPLVVVLLTVSVALHLLGTIVFYSRDAEMYGSLFAAFGFDLIALILVWRGRLLIAAGVCGWAFWDLATLSPQLGTAAAFHLFILIPSFLILTLIPWPIWKRVSLAFVPPVMLVIRLYRSPPIPPENGLFPPEQMRHLATFNLLVVIVLLMAITIHTLRIKEWALARTQERGWLIDDLRHALRTPLAILRTDVQEALQGEPSEAPCRATLQEIDQRTGALGRQIERMLDMSRAEHFEPEIIEQNDDLLASVRKIVDGFRALAESCSVSLVLIVPDESLKQRTNTGALQHVLGNLLSNAIRFTPPGKRVEVQISGVDFETWIIVRDQGPGIADDDRPHIFEDYWRADKASTRERGHPGLGLAAARHYARLLGATVEVESTSGEGAVFTVRLQEVSKLE